MRQGGDSRGSSHSRLLRKLWLLRAFGDGTMAPCAHCETWLPAAGLEADRVNPGGTYARGNIVPACRRCNASRGACKPSPALRAMARRAKRQNV